MGVSRRRLVFGTKRLPSEEDCAEHSLRIMTTTRERELGSPNISPNRPLNGVVESGGEDNSRDVNNEQNESNDLQPTDVKKAVVSKRKTGTFWGLDEAMAFYEGVKEHGKNFEKIVLTLNRKKVTKDKDQVRNYFYNTWKIYKDKAGIAENDWSHLCPPAKELLIVINALEWRKRTHSTNVNPMKFKTLIMSGLTNVKMPGKRVPISIRTPNCTALHKFFPSLKQSSKTPSTLQIELAPNSYSSKRYVLSCEQNPCLTIAVNTQASISTLFKFLEQKWHKFPNQEPMTTSEQGNIVLYPVEGFKPSKVLISPAIDSHPSIKTYPGLSSNSAKPESSNETKIPTNVFEILGEQLINGLNAENVANTNFLHLYLLFNQSTIKLRYDVVTNVRSSNVFIKLSELIRNSEGIIDNVKTKKKPSTPEFAVPQTSATAATKRLPNFRMANIGGSGTTNIVDNEREKFKEQLMALRQKSNDPQKIGKTMSGKPANKRMCIASSQSDSHQQLSVATHHDSSLEESLDAFGFPHYRRKHPTSVQNGKTFTSLQSVPHSSQEPSSSATNVFEDVANSEISRNSSSVLLPSPTNNKSLHDEAYNYYVSMNSQSSNDIIATFSQLINAVNESSQSGGLE